MDNPDGMVSNYLHARVNQGDILKVSAPAGDFVLDTEKSTPVVLLSGGVGLTPMMSMLKTVVEVQPERKVTFVHATVNGNVHALRDEVDEVSNLENVTSYFFYDSPTEEDRKNNRFDVEGYVTRDWLKEKIDTKDADFYFCGPVPFMKAINRSLKELGVNEERIHFEFFGPMGNLEE
jgi:nitric oxide dioxygenase